MLLSLPCGAARGRCSVQEESVALAVDILDGGMIRPNFPLKVQKVYKLARFTARHVASEHCRHYAACIAAVIVIAVLAARAL